MSSEKQFTDLSNSTQPLSVEKDDFPQSKPRIIKNLIVVSIGFLLLFTAFQSLSNLQSSINTVEGLGTAGLAVIYGALVLSCLILPPFIIHILGCKWTIPISMLCYILYMFANLYPQWWTIVPTACILGIGGAPLWSAKCSYLTETGIWYAKMNKETEEVVITRFFGIFFFFFQTSQIWGNLISSLVLVPEEQFVNGTNRSSFDYSLCGADFCPDTNITATKGREIPDSQRYLLCGIYIGCAFLGMIIVSIFLDKITLERRERTTISLDLFKRTVMHLRHGSQLLLIPLTMYSGLEQAFIAADFTKSYITCALGVRWVGFILICYGVSDAISSFLTGYVVKIVGRAVIFIFAFIVHTSIKVTLLLWQPNPDQIWVFFVIAVCWGMCDAVWQTQINALYGCLYPRKQEEAFSNYRLWESLGFIIAFGYSYFLCAHVKLYILIGWLVVGISGYIVVETRIRLKERQSGNITHIKE